jgi:hypothetical protein
MRECKDARGPGSVRRMGLADSGAAAVLRSPGVLVALRTAVATLRSLSQPRAVALYLALAGAFGVAAAAFGGTERVPEHRRVVGYGQTRFDGAGPERWAMRFRRERRAAAHLRMLLAGRLDRLVFLVQAFECVHGREGSWSAHTGNGYYGGLQFGAPEWRRFGGGFASRADLASPAQQIAAGIAYHAVAGFEPWPNTARACGLR